MIDYLKKHENIPHTTLKWEGKRVYLINNFTGVKHIFLAGETEVIIPPKEAKEIKDRYEKLKKDESTTKA